MRSLLEVGNLLLAGENGQILASDDVGETWAVADTTPTNECRGLYDDGDNVWAGDNGNVLKSTDGGRNWAVDSALPTGYVHAFIEETSTGDVRAGDSGRILILDASDTVTLGRDETDLDEIRHKLGGVPLVGRIPYDQRLTEGVMRDQDGEFTPTPALTDLLPALAELITQVRQLV